MPAETGVRATTQEWAAIVADMRRDVEEAARSQSYTSGHLNGQMSCILPVLRRLIDFVEQHMGTDIGAG